MGADVNGARSPRTSVVFSLSWSLALGITDDDLPPGWHTDQRASDWGKRGAAARLFLVREGVRAAWRARRARVFVLATAGIELVAAGLASMVLSPRQRRVAFDVLVPTSTRLDPVLRLLLRPWHLFCCIRTNDRGVLRERFGVGEERTTFVSFVANADGLDRSGLEITDDGYAYSAGRAHRDWRTLFAALEGTTVRAVIGVGDGPVPEMSADLANRSTVRRPDQPIGPDEGRRLAARSRFIVAAMERTDLPSGPLVLLDAMALGKPIVASAVAGVVDYCDHDVDALLVAPGDVVALRTAMERLDADAELRDRLGRAARERAAALTPAALIARISEAIETVEASRR